MTVGFKVLIAAVIKDVFWDITLRSPLKVNQRFGGTCRLHLQGRRISQERNKRESRWEARFHTGFLVGFIWPLTQANSSGINGVGSIRHKTVLWRFCACF
jgi:hypothetical protein